MNLFSNYIGKMLLQLDLFIVILISLDVICYGYQGAWWTSQVFAQDIAWKVALMCSFQLYQIILKICEGIGNRLREPDLIFIFFEFISEG